MRWQERFERFLEIVLTALALIVALKLILAFVSQFRPLTTDAFQTSVIHRSITNMGTSALRATCHQSTERSLLMKNVICRHCDHQNHYLEHHCGKCGKPVDAAGEFESMPLGNTRLLSTTLPVPKSHSVSLPALEVGVIKFASFAEWWMKPQGLDSPVNLSSLQPGGMTNHGAVLDFIANEPGHRILVTDGVSTEGPTFSQCLARIHAERERWIKWAVIGIREPGWSWNPDLPHAASNKRLYTESAVDAGLGKALTDVSRSITELYKPTRILCLIDTSGSMAEGSKARMAAQAVITLMQSLRDQAAHPVTSAIQRWTE